MNPVSTAELDLLPFCRGNLFREWASQPWYEASINATIVTDGCIMLILDGHHPQAVKRHVATPDNEPWSVFNLFRQVPMGPLPPLPPLETEVCSWCNGTGNEPDADGRCEECNGEKAFELILPVKLGRALFGSSYLRKIACLPEVRFEADPEPASPASFEFAGGRGLLMARGGDQDEA